MFKNISVFGIFQDREQVDFAVSALRRSGFRAADISLLLPENSGTKDIAVEKASKSPEGAVLGMGIGALLGGGLGWLSGIGTLAIPGVEALLAAGPLVSAMAGVGAGATLCGILGAISGLGIPEYEAKRFEGRVRKAGILLSAHCDDTKWAKLARHILRTMGGQHVASTSESTADFAATDKPFSRVAVGP